MTRETKIALLVGLMFIICFGIILGGARTEQAASAPEPIPVAAGTDTLPNLTARELARPAVPVAHPEALARRLPVFRPPTPAPTASAVPPPAAAVNAAPAVQPAAAPRRARTYVAADGDTLWTVAGKAYGLGNERFHTLIAEANRDVLPNPDRLTIGLKLRIPPLPSVADRTARSERLRDRLRRAARPTDRRTGPTESRGRPAAATTYTVKSGDTLTAIARRTLGSASEANIDKLFGANRDKLPNRDTVPLGAVLRIPR